MQKPVFFCLFFFLPGLLLAQMHNYWSYNFNEESSLVAGAVVGGGAGASAIFYNPATISEINTSKLSLNASLVSFDITNSKNILGENIPLKSTRFYAVPRFVSYMHKPKSHPNWSLEFAFMNVNNYELSTANFTNKKINIINNLPGEERYVAFTEYDTKYRNDFFGIGGSHILRENLYFGMSMFVSVKSFYSRYQLDINAQPELSNLFRLVEENSYYTASQATQEIIKFNDYRLLWKFGFLYKKDRLSFGLNFTTPSIGGIYSDGKRVMHKEAQSNINNPNTGEPLPDFLITDYAEKKDVKVNYKTPFSIGVGTTINSLDNKRIFYATIEYFGKVNLYKIVSAESNQQTPGNPAFLNPELDEWLTYYFDANPVFNAALGYRWYLKDHLMLLAGFKTDFNYKKYFESDVGDTFKTIPSIGLNLYHLSSGLTLRIFGQDITAGIQYSFGINNKKKQIVNLSHPVEFNFEELRALQGTRTYTAKSVHNSITLLLAASFNFGTGENKKNQIDD